MEYAEKVLEDDNFYVVVYLGTALGFTLALHYFLRALIVFRKQAGYLDSPVLLRRFFETSDMVGTTHQKRAGTRKINTILENARSMHGAVTDIVDQGPTSSMRESQSDSVFQNYTLFGESHEEAGSLLWTWQLLYSGRLFDSEGIWLPSRLHIFQLGQILVTCFIAVGHFQLLNYSVDAAEEATGNLPDGLPQWVYDIVPTPQQVKIALQPAGAVAIIVCVVLTVIYIPR